MDKELKDAADKMAEALQEIEIPCVAVRKVIAPVKGCECWACEKIVEIHAALDAYEAAKEGKTKMPPYIWSVKETPCWPAKWKVFPLHTYREENSPDNYFVSESLARIECARRNREEEEKEKN